MQHKRNGELSPTLSKIECIFFPRRNRIDRVELLVCTLWLMLLIAILGYAPSKIADILVAVPTRATWIDVVLFALSFTTVFAKALVYYVSVRANYYRLQDFNVKGRVTYYIQLPILLLVLIAECLLYAPISSHLLTHENIELFTNILRGIESVWAVSLLFIPGSKGSNKFGSTP